MASYNYTGLFSIAALCHHAQHPPLPHPPPPPPPLISSPLPHPTALPAGSKRWTGRERQQFRHAWRVHRKQFQLIRSAVENKLLPEVIEYYYSWKKYCNDEYRGRNRHISEEVSNPYTSPSHITHPHYLRLCQRKMRRVDVLHQLPPVPPAPLLQGIWTSRPPFPILDVVVSSSHHYHQNSWNTSQEPTSLDSTLQCKSTAASTRAAIRLVNCRQSLCLGKQQIAPNLLCWLLVVQ